MSVIHNKTSRIPHRRQQRGFTLIEVLVSIAIFAAMSVAAYQVVSQIQMSEQVSRQRTERLNELQRALVYLDNDFRQIALRQFRTNGEDPIKKVLVWQDNLLDSDSKGVLFTRLGWLNPQQQFPRGEVTKVGYRIHDNVLQRVWWRYPDTPVGQQGTITPLLTQVDAFSLNFYDGKTWLKEWDKNFTLPQAIKLNIELHDYGHIERIYLTPDGQVFNNDNTNENGSDDSSESAS